MGGDADSKIAWHRVQLKKNRDALKALESSRFTSGEIAKGGRTQTTIADLKRKILESERLHRGIREANQATRRDRFSQPHNRELGKLERSPGLRGL